MAAGNAVTWVAERYPGEANDFAREDLAGNVAKQVAAQVAGLVEKMSAPESITREHSGKLA